MPTFEAELQDGRKIRFEADRAPSDDELKAWLDSQSKNTPKTTPGGAALRTGLTSLAPTAAAAAAFTPGMEAGASLGTAVLPGVGTVAGGLVGGLGASAIAALGASFAQKKVLETVAPGFLKEEQAGEEQHPIAAGVGRLAAAAPSFTVGLPKTVADLAKRIAVQEVIGAGQTLAMQKRLPTAGEAVESAVFGAAYGRPQNFLLSKAARLKLMPNASRAVAAEKKGAPDASEIREAKTVHGDVRTFTLESEGEVPAESGRAGVLPETETGKAQAELLRVEPKQRQLSRIEQTPEGKFRVSKKTQSGEQSFVFDKVLDAQFLADRLNRGGKVEATPEEDAVEKAEKEAIQSAQASNAESGLPSEVGGDDSETVPFASGELAKTNRQGKIVLNLPELRPWMQKLGKRSGEALKAVFSEEGIHSLARKALSDDEASGLWKSLPQWQRFLRERSYLGIHYNTLKGRYSDAQMGHEYLRVNMQRLLRLTPTEIAESRASGKDLIPQHLIDAAERVINFVRDTLGTKMSATMRAMMSKIGDNIGAARGQAPAAISRQPLTSAAQKVFDEAREAKDEFTPVDTSHLSAAERRSLAESGLSFSVDRKNRILATYPQRLRVEDLRNKVLSKRAPAALSRQPSEYARDSIEDFEKNAGELESAGKIEAAKNFREMADALKKKYPDWQERGFSAALQRSFDLPVTEKHQVEERMAGRPAFNAAAIENEARQHIEQSPTPSFKQFVEATGAKYMRRMDPADLREVYKHQINTALDAAPASRLKELLIKLNLAERVGAVSGTIKKGEGLDIGLKIETPKFKPTGSRGGVWREIAEPKTGKEKIQGKLPQAGVTTPGFVMAGTRQTGYGPKPIYGPMEPFKPSPTRVETRQLVSPSDKLRASAIRAISEKLREQADQTSKPLTRTDVTPDELSNQYGGHLSISTDEAANPEELGRKITQGSGTHRSKGSKVSDTHRVVVMVNKQTGKTFMLDVYNEGPQRRGVVVQDPVAPTHTRLSSLISLGYQPVESFRLDEPINNFKKSWGSLSEYQKDFGEKAREVSKPQLVSAEIPGTEGEFAQRTPGEMVPAWTKVAGIHEAGLGLLRTSEPITDAEAKSVYESIISASGGKRDPQMTLDKLRGQAVTPEKLRLAVAFNKIFHAIADRYNWDVENPELAQATYDQTIEELKQHAGEADNPDAFSKRLLQRYAEVVPEGRGPASAGGVEGGRQVPGLVSLAEKLGGVEAPTATRPEPTTGARELTLRRDIPPTRIPGQPLPKGPGPTPTLPPAKPPEMLSPAEQQAVQSRAAEEFPTAKEVPISYGVQPPGEYGGPRFRPPATRPAFSGQPERFPFEKPYQTPPPETPEAEDNLKADFEQEHGPSQMFMFEDLDAEDHGGEIEGEVPAAIQRIWDEKKGEAAKMIEKGVAFVSRKETTRTITENLDGTETSANDNAIRWSNPVRLAAKGNKAVLSAVRAVLQSGGVIQDKYGNYKVTAPRLQTLAGFEGKVKLAFAAAQRASSSSNPVRRLIGLRWEKACEALFEEINYARDHWDDPELKEASIEARRALDDQRGREIAAGKNTKSTEDYFPGRYDAEFFNDNAIVFGNRTLGGAYWGRKVFKTYYDAIMGDKVTVSPGKVTVIGTDSRPYISRSNNAADIVESRLRAGMRGINKTAWFRQLKNMTDPDSKQPIAAEPKMIPVYDLAGNIVSYNKQPINAEHALVHIGPDTLSVRKGYSDFVEAITARSRIADSTGGAAMLRAASFLKHNLLLGDFFHLARLNYYAASIMGTKAWRGGKPAYQGGLSALNYNEADLPRAVAGGFISQDSADWATTKIRYGSKDISRHTLIRLAEAKGANLGKIQDAIYLDITKQFPILGKYNRFLFEKFTRGIMAESLVSEFERLTQGKTLSAAEAETQLRTVNRSINQYFGNIGRQGILKTATQRDLAQLVFLAPQWVEGLAAKEIGAVRDLSRYVKNRGAEPIGTIGLGIGRGLVTMLGLSLALKAMTKKYAPDDKGHPVDAWIPDVTGKSPGFWFSPLSVFAELTHDIIRLHETKAKNWDILQQIGENKLSPFGRAAVIGMTDTSPRGEYLGSTGAVLKEIGKAAAPVPISFGRVGQALISTTGLMQPPPAGTLQRQIAGSLGLKIEPARSALQAMQAKAAEWVKANGAQSAWKFVPTDGPSYQKLISVIRQGDQRGAANMLNALRAQGHTDDQIINAMKRHATHPFTRSDALERRFVHDLTPAEREEYAKAMQQKQDDWTSFVTFYLNAAKASR